MILVKNNAKSSLSVAIDTDDTTVVLQTGEGDLFPSISGGNIFFITVSSANFTEWEIMKVTGRSSDTLTVVREQEGTTALEFSTGSPVQLLITAGLYEDLRDNSLRSDRNNLIEDSFNISFGDNHRNELVLYNNGAGSVFEIGTQTDTLYNRSKQNFAWFLNGVHSNTELDPGSGGSLLMTLNDLGHLLIGAGADVSNDLLQVNGGIRSTTLTVTGAANVNASQLGSVGVGSFVRTDYYSSIIDPYTLSFSGGPRESLYLNKSSFYDPYFANVKLLLHANGTNNSTIIVDSSLRNSSLAFSGSAVISTTQQKFGVSSFYFPGGNDYISMSASSDFNFLSYDFTIEFWLYPTAIGGTRRWLGWEAATQSLFIREGSSNLQAFIRVGSSTVYTLSTSTAPTANAWQHIALVRVGNVYTLYKNGTSVGTMTQAGSIDISAVPMYMSWSGGEQYTGYIDEVRITIGTARYTSNFTPDVVEFADFMDQNEFDPYYGNVELLIHGIGVPASQSIFDNSPSPKTLTASGSVAFSTAQYKFPTSSIYFNGSSDYISIGTIPNYLDNLATSAFTIEFWIYINGNIITNTYPVIYSAENSSSRRYTIFYYGTTGQSVVNMCFTNYVSNEYCIASNVSAFAWHHVAFVCNTSKQMKLYIDGVLKTTTTFTTTLNVDESLTHRLGRGVNLSDYSNMYLQDFRITAGVQRYTSDFVPPWRLFPDKTSYSVDQYYNMVPLLMHFNDADQSTTFVDTSLSPHTMTTVGDAKHVTSIQKFGSSCAYFDGSGDGIRCYNTDFVLGTGDFTIETWVYLINGGKNGQTYTRIFELYAYSNSPNTGSLALTCKASENPTHLYADINYTTGIESANTLSNDVWHHVAITRKGTLFTLWVDGVSAGTLTYSIDFTRYNLSIGCNANGGESFYGYLDEFRITKGVARYTTTFNVPTEPFGEAVVKYSLGTQPNYLYQRSPYGFAWFLKGTHSSLDLNPGTSGALLAYLVGGALIIREHPTSLYASVEVGRDRLSNGYAYIDFIGDTTYTDFGLRLIRNNSGANTTSYLSHRGTGSLYIQTLEAANLIFNTSNTDRMTVLSSGRVLIGAASDDGTSLLHINGDLNLYGTSRRIKADFSNNTLGYCGAFQSSTTNGRTSVYLIPNGSSNLSELILTNNSTLTNASIFLAHISTAVTFASSRYGSGTFLPILFKTSDIERMNLTINGNLLIGTSTDNNVAKLVVSASTTVPSPTSGTILHLASATDAQCRITIDGFGTNADPILAGRRSRGTAASPSATQANDNLLIILGYGYDTTWNGSSRVYIGFNAAENFSGSANGTYIRFATTPTSSTTISERMRINSTGNILIGTTTDNTIEKLQVNGSIFATNIRTTPESSVSPVNNGDLVWEATNDTTITIKYKGSDGTVRSGTISLA